MQPIVLSTFMLCVVAAGRFASADSFIGLGHLPGKGFYSSAADVSADGSVVVGFSGQLVLGDYAGVGEAFRWTREGGMVGLGFLPEGSASLVGGVSADGASVAGFSGNILANLAPGEAFRWTNDAGMSGLGFLSGRNASSASAISGDGSVVVGQSHSESTANSAEAFRWTNADGMIGLGDLPGGDSWSDATGVSADGSVVVGRSHGVDGEEAFRWTSEAGMVGLGVLPNATFSRAQAVSADGAVVVGASYTAASATSNASNEAFRWTSAEGMVGLGDLPGGPHWSLAADVSADGGVIVGTASNGTEAFIWDPIHGMQSISDVLIASGVDLTGWRLTVATAISADGTTIVGYGYNPAGNTEAWLARINPIPEPDTFVLSCFALMCLVRALRGFRPRAHRWRAPLLPEPPG